MTSGELYQRALKVIPGGVNSPVRAFGSVGGTPIFVRRAEGAYVEDEEGRRYIDYVGSWGPMLFGHADPEVIAAITEAAASSTSFGAPTRAEVEMAELICELVPSIESVRMVNSGTEATMSAVRLARGYTGRDRIIKFEGNYHGHADFFLIAAGSGATTFGQPNSPGVTKATARDTLIARYNDLEHVRELVEEYSGEIAAIILEPVAGNMGCIPPEPGFLEGLRATCDDNDIILIFDEVMTGFRVARGGAQELYGVTPDLTTLGKVIGGGLPVGAYGGRREIMERLSPAGPIYQAGTLSGNPLAMAAGLTVLRRIAKHPEVYDRLEKTGSTLEEGTRRNLNEVGLDFTTTRVGSMGCLFFTDGRVVDYAGAKRSDTALFARYFHAMLERGIYLAPSQFEAFFVSTRHGVAEIEQTLAAQREALREITIITENSES
ncbi:MAG: glutamate-1-semialdehyde 2,1-aminomutase [Rhodothermales bacterium]